MRAARLPLLALPLLLTYCGSKQDLIIGELALSSDAAGTSSAGSGAAPSTGGSETGETAGSAGSAAELGGAGGQAGADLGGAGAGGLGAGGEEPCVDGERPPTDSLIHRYSFDGTGTQVVDSVGGADGTLMNGATLDGTGVLQLAGNSSKQYADLPNGLVSALSEVTLVTWVTWKGGGAYQRIFDFGISNAGEGQSDAGRSYLAVMPITGFDDQRSPGLGAEFKVPGTTLQIATTEDMEDRFAQVAFSFRSGSDAALYLDANLMGRQPTAIELADIDDRNDWLGRSQWGQDPFFQGSYEEFRIYDAALNSCQLHTLLVRGPQTP